MVLWVVNTVLIRDIPVTKPCSLSKSSGAEMDGVEAAGATRALSLSSPLAPSLPQYLSGGGPWCG